MQRVVDLQSCSLVELKQGFAQSTDTIRLAQGRRSEEPRLADASAEMVDRQAVDHMDLVEVTGDNLPDSAAGHTCFHSNCG